jgi:sulfotransferase
MKVFYQSSMPRSGSTVLQNILHENKLIYATPTDGLCSLIQASRNQFTEGQEFKAQDKGLMDKAFIGYCKGAINSFYEAITDRPYVVSKSREWGILYNLINRAYPSPKIICMVRDLRDVFTSMEINYRNNPTQTDFSVNYNNFNATTVSKRVNHWANSAPVGISLEKMKDLIEQGLDKNILFIRYEDLCENPEKEMKKLYMFLEIDYFKHDFNNIEQRTHENDNIYGVYGDHKIRLKLEKKPSRALEIIGQGLCDGLIESFDWYFKKFNYIK